MNVYDHAELNDAGARYWLAMDGWDKDQAAYLLHAIDPLLLKVWTKASGGRLEINFPEQFDSLTAMIARAFEAGALRFPAAPSAVIAWANSKNLKLPVQFIGYSEPSSAPVVAVSASGGIEPTKAGPVDKGWVMKRKALMEKHAAQWPTVGRDFQDASANELSKDAKAPGHGNWFEAAALNWARQRGKLTEDKQQGPASLSTVWTGKTHTIGG